MIFNLIKNTLLKLLETKQNLREIRSEYLFRHKDDINVSNRLFRLINLIEIIESDLKDLGNIIKK
jgi:hypothetical protein